jgi:hypothetical protein
MRQVVVGVALFLAVALAGCGGFGDVIKGGGEKVTVDAAGVISVSGHVVNRGEGRARDVTLTFRFSQKGAVYLTTTLSLGTIPGGETKKFAATFYGPVPDRATFGWDYGIDWD